MDNVAVPIVAVPKYFIRCRGCGFARVILLFDGATAQAQKAPSARPFERFDACVMEPDEWTDGDSFRVRLPDGRLETFRLYYVDTTESRSRGKRRGCGAALQSRGG
jgi:endonuclease YncB( thermonuclease family)